MGRPLQDGRAALAAGGGRPAAVPPGAVRAAGLRSGAHAEPRRLVPPRVPQGAPGDPRARAPRAAARPRRLPRRGAAARPAQDARPLLPDRLPVHRDHQRVQLQVHVVPGRDHGSPARLHEEGAGLPHPRRDRGEAAVPRPALPGQAAPDGRADAAPRSRRDRRAGRVARRADRAQHQLRPHHAGARRRALPRPSHEPDPVVPDAGPGDVQDPQGAEARLRRVPRQGPPRGRKEGRARGPHEPRDRHHEHEVRRRLPHRQRGRAGASRSSPTGSRSAASSSGGTGSSRGRTTSRRSARRGSSTATRTAAATRFSTAYTSSGSAATPGAT